MSSSDFSKKSARTQGQDRPSSTLPSATSAVSVAAPAQSLRVVHTETQSSSFRTVISPLRLRAGTRIVHLFGDSIDSRGKWYAGTVKVATDAAHKQICMKINIRMYI
jgi:hypothetical protein